MFEISYEDAVKNEEIWKPITGYEGFYEVSDKGRIKSLSRKVTGAGVVGDYIKKERILKTPVNKNGYYGCNLYKNGTKRRVDVHRMVALTFISNPNELPFINHKDEDKLNNQIDNLEWCTAKYNCNYGTGNKRRIENTDYDSKVENTDYKEISRKLSKKVCAINALTGEKYYFNSAKEASILLGVSSGNISSILTGKRKNLKLKGYTFVEVKDV